MGSKIHLINSLLTNTSTLLRPSIRLNADPKTCHVLLGSLLSSSVLTTDI